ncbi:hypothetical protein BBK36DRAFT_1140116 [Trichoderma citrinoviride]|uniref:Uncharacterized protein n=1 Tax=Trichoderma citrinoviride TaxID=58853 RepID=A0A2T4BDR6_9HYPO|nr:hypothetical protein BBK36DRAFT_1140116 [Trichoderma citrinoviride]PTB67466.1 hypothetical protein BBK36DRAFT_1140116 [Trichoderma citrinoviride]
MEGKPALAPVPRPDGIAIPGSLRLGHFASGRVLGAGNGLEYPWPKRMYRCYLAAREVPIASNSPTELLLALVKRLDQGLRSPGRSSVSLRMEYSVLVSSHLITLCPRSSTKYKHDANTTSYSHYFARSSVPRQPILFDPNSKRVLPHQAFGRPHWLISYSMSLVHQLRF